MKLTEFISNVFINNDKAFISITGGGGKTTLMEKLAFHLSSNGKSVLMTTTTKVASPYLHDYGASRIFSDESILAYIPSPGDAIFYAEHHPMDMKKWIAPREEVLEILSSRYDIVISEADGSRGLPLKIHTSRDPVIHPSTTHVIAVMGMWGIGEKACSSVFGSDEDVIVDRSYIQHYIDMPEGLLKGSIEEHTAIIFNGAENSTCDEISMLNELSYPAGVIALAASEKNNRIISVIA